jgi:ParB family chromosome partitioning protein
MLHMPFFMGRTAEKVINRVINIPVGQIVPNPYQPRREFGSDIAELAESIKANGILQPLTVRAMDNNTYQLVAGERRLRAAKLAGFEEVPCITVNITDRNSAVMALVENIQRRDLSFFDEAQAIDKLIDFYGLTQEDAAARLGKSQPTVANKLRLLKLSDTERAKITEFGLTERHARALLKLNGGDDRLEAIENIRLKKLNVEQTERMIDGMLIARKETDRVRKTSGMFRDVRLFVNTISHAVEVMRAAGINAEATQNKTPEYTEYIIKIPNG